MKVNWVNWDEYPQYMGIIIKNVPNQKPVLYLYILLRTWHISFRSRSAFTFFVEEYHHIIASPDKQRHLRLLPDRRCSQYWPLCTSDSQTPPLSHRENNTLIIPGVASCNQTRQWKMDHLQVISYENLHFWGISRHENSIFLAKLIFQSGKVYVSLGQYVKVMTGNLNRYWESSFCHLNGHDEKEPMKIGGTIPYRGPSWLVVYLPLWKILVNWDDYSQCMEK